MGQGSVLASLRGPPPDAGLLPDGFPRATTWLMTAALASALQTLLLSRSRPLIGSSLLLRGPSSVPPRQRSEKEAETEGEAGNHAASRGTKPLQSKGFSADNL